MDRVLVSLPVPWGIWCLLIELYENPKYGFLSQDFFQGAPELLEHIERRVNSIKSSSHPSFPESSSASAITAQN